jgi:hypothetical protein
MGNFFNNGQIFFKLIVRVRIYRILIKIWKKKCWFENWIFKNLFLEIYRSQTDYIQFSNKEDYEAVDISVPPWDITREGLRG